MLLINRFKRAFLWYDADDARFRVEGIPLFDWLTKPSRPVCKLRSQYLGDLFAWRSVWAEDDVVKWACPDYRRAVNCVYDLAGADVSEYIDLSSLIAGLLIHPKDARGFETLNNPNLRMLCLMESYLRHSPFMVDLKGEMGFTLISDDGRLRITYHADLQRISSEFGSADEPIFRAHWVAFQCPLLPVIASKINAHFPQSFGFRGLFNRVRALQRRSWNTLNVAAFLFARMMAHSVLKMKKGGPFFSGDPPNFNVGYALANTGLTISQVSIGTSLTNSRHPCVNSFTRMTLVTRDGLVLPALSCPQQSHGLNALHNPERFLRYFRLVSSCVFPATRMLGEFLQLQMQRERNRGVCRDLSHLKAPRFIIDLMNQHTEHWLRPREIQVALKQRTSPVRFSALAQALVTNDRVICDALLHSALLGELLVRMPDAMEVLRHHIALRSVVKTLLGTSLRSMKALDTAIPVEHRGLLLVLFPVSTYKELLPFLGALSSEELGSFLNERGSLPGLSHFLIELMETPDEHLPPELFDMRIEAPGAGRMLALWRMVGHSFRGHQRFLHALSSNSTLNNGAQLMDLSFRQGENLWDWWMRVCVQLQHPYRWLNQLRFGVRTDSSQIANRWMHDRFERVVGAMMLIELRTEWELDLVGRHMRFCLSASYAVSMRVAGLTRLFLIHSCESLPELAVLELRREANELPWQAYAMNGPQNSTPTAKFNESANWLISEINAS